MSLKVSNLKLQSLLSDPAALINCLEDSILLLDRKSIIRFINKAGEELFGRSHRDIIGRKLTEIIPDDAAAIARLSQKAIKESRSFSAKEVDAKIHGTSMVDFRISPFFSDDKCEGVLLYISKNLSIVEKEDLSFDSLVYLLGSIAHEIKNPLGGIKGAAQLLKKRLQRDDKNNNEYLNLIIKETERLNSVLQSYLTMSRKPLLHPINVHEVLEKAVSIMNISLENGSISLQRIYDPSLPKVMGDEGKLLQVFVNVIKNAIEAMSKGGRLMLATIPSSEYVVHNGQTKKWAVISISDTGKGIPKDEMPKIFMPFYTKKKKGTGLGLALSKKIIKDHDGFIKAESLTANQKGTVVSIGIPFC